MLSLLQKYFFIKIDIVQISFDEQLSSSIRQPTKREIQKFVSLCAPEWNDFYVQEVLHAPAQITG